MLQTTRMTDGAPNLEATLRGISRNLWVGSLNYCASFKLARCPGRAGQPLCEILAEALGEGVAIGGSIAATPFDVLCALKDAIEYRGDDGHHPSQEYLNTRQFREAASLALAQAGELLSGSDYVVSFWLERGHPFYPVYWDFAFMTEKGDDAFVFIGSSSD